MPAFLIDTSLSYAIAKQRHVLPSPKVKSAIIYFFQSTSVRYMYDVHIRKYGIMMLNGGKGRWSAARKNNGVPGLRYM